MTIREASSVDQQAPAAATEPSNEVIDLALLRARAPSAITTGTVLLFLWLGFHWDDFASWMVGLPTAIIGGALTLFLPTSVAFRLSPFGVLRFAVFAIGGVLRGAIDVTMRTLSPRSLQAGCLNWQTSLPEGRPRQLFALAITLMPGTLTARIEGEFLTVHALNLTDGTREELAELERYIAALYRLDQTEAAP